MSQPNANRRVVTEGTVRIGPIMALPDVLADLGADADALLAEFGLAAEDFRDPENTLPFRTAGMLLRRCAAVTGSDRLGLLVGSRATLSSLGATGFLMQSAPTVGAALRGLAEHLHLHDRGATIALRNHDGRVTLEYAIIVANVEAVDQIYTVAALIGNTILRTLCGNGWKAREVQLPLRRPRCAPELQKALNAPLRFETERLGIVFAAADLDRTPATADPLLHRMMSDRIRELEALAQLRLADRVRRLLRTMVLIVNCTPQAVARRLGTSLRTLNRRLADEGTSLRRLRDEACHDVARHLLAHSDKPAREIGLMLGYSDASAFTRAFTRWAGVGPAQWRASRAAGSGPASGRRRAGQ